MEHQLIISTGNGFDREGHQLVRQHNVIAETNLEADPLGFPDSFAGKLAGVTEEQLIQFRDAVEVGFLGKRYKFSRLEKDGKFELRKDW